MVTALIFRVVHGGGKNRVHGRERDPLLHHPSHQLCRHAGKWSFLSRTTTPKTHSHCTQKNPKPTTTVQTKSRKETYYIKLALYQLRPSYLFSFLDKKNES